MSILTTDVTQVTKSVPFISCLPHQLETFFISFLQHTSRSCTQYFLYVNYPFINSCVAHSFSTYFSWLCKFKFNHFNPLHYYHSTSAVFVTVKFIMTPFAEVLLYFAHINQFASFMKDRMSAIIRTLLYKIDQGPTEVWVPFHHNLWLALFNLYLTYDFHTVPIKNF